MSMARVLMIAAGMTPGRNLRATEANMMAYIVFAPNPIPSTTIAAITRIALRIK